MKVSEAIKKLSAMDEDAELRTADFSPVEFISMINGSICVGTIGEEEASGTEYCVTINERLSTRIVLVAENEEEALHRVKGAYETREISLSLDDWADTNFTIEEN